MYRASPESQEDVTDDEDTTVVLDDNELVDLVLDMLDMQQEARMSSNSTITNTQTKDGAVNLLNCFNFNFFNFNNSNTDDNININIDQHTKPPPKVQPHNAWGRAKSSGFGQSTACNTSDEGIKSSSLPTHGWVASSAVSAYNDVGFSLYSRPPLTFLQS
jgi:hypothetical protein